MSYMKQELWNQLEQTSNAAEQAGQKGYRTGTQCSVLDAIKK